MEEPTDLVELGYLEFAGRRCLYESLPPILLNVVRKRSGYLVCGWPALLQPASLLLDPTIPALFGCCEVFVGLHGAVNERANFIGLVLG